MNHTNAPRSSESQDGLKRRKIIMGGVLAGTMGVAALCYSILHTQDAQPNATVPSAKTPENKDAEKLRILLRDYNVLYTNCENMRDADVILLSDFHYDADVTAMNRAVMEKVTNTGDVLLLEGISRDKGAVNANEHDWTKGWQGKNVHMQGWEKEIDYVLATAAQKNRNEIIDKCQEAFVRGDEKEGDRLFDAMLIAQKAFIKYGDTRTENMLHSVQEQTGRGQRVLVAAGSDHITDPRVEQTLKTANLRYTAIELKMITDHNKVLHEKEEMLLGILGKKK